ncbi:MAG: helix-hairpin-helix domain-containing protein [Lachnospiraceae bacterium]|jgi:competence protein ComEA
MGASAAFVILSGLFYTAACAGCLDRSEADEVRIEQSEDSTEPESALVTQEPCTVVVYVCGEVENEGVYTLPAGSRVTDAIEMAGGEKDGADLKQLNLAETVSDSQKILVPRAAEDENAGNTGEQQETDGRIDINQAGKSELMTLPGIGEAKAEAILQYRSENGAFASPEDIMNVPGIKQSAYEKIRDRIKV